MHLGHCSAAMTILPPTWPPVDDDDFLPPPPHAAATSASARTATRNGELCRTCRTLSEPPVSRQRTPRPRLSDSDGENDRGEAEDDGRGHGDSVQIAFDNGGSRGASAHAAA